MSSLYDEMRDPLRQRQPRNTYRHPSLGYDSAPPTQCDGPSSASSASTWEGYNGGDARNAKWVNRANKIRESFNTYVDTLIEKARYYTDKYVEGGISFPGLMQIYEYDDEPEYTQPEISTRPKHKSGKRRISKLGLLLVLLCVAFVCGLGVYVALSRSRVGFKRAVTPRKPDVLANIPKGNDVNNGVDDVDDDMTRVATDAVALDAFSDIVSGKTIETQFVKEENKPSTNVEKEEDKVDLQRRNRFGDNPRMPINPQRVGETTNPRFDRIAVGVLVKQYADGDEEKIVSLKFLRQVKNLLIVKEFDDDSDEDGGAGADAGKTVGETVSVNAGTDASADTDDDVDDVDDDTEEDAGKDTAGNDAKDLKVDPQVLTKRIKLGHALRALRALHASAAGKVDWYILTNPETHLFLENINEYIIQKKLDPTTPTFIGNSIKTASQCPGTTATDALKPIPLDLPVALIESGMLFSRAAVNSLVGLEGQIDKCIEKFGSCATDDEVLTLCLNDIGLRLAQDKRFDTTPIKEISWPRDACIEPFSVIDVPDYIENRFYSIQYSVAIHTAGHVINWDHRMTYAYVFSHLYNELGLVGASPNTDRGGTEIMQIRRVSGAECLSSCKRLEACLAWSFNIAKTMCSLKSDISPSVKKTAVVSGVIVNRYVCKKSSFKF